MNRIEEKQINFINKTFKAVDGLNGAEQELMNNTLYFKSSEFIKKWNNFKKDVLKMSYLSDSNGDKLCRLGTVLLLINRHFNEWYNGKINYPLKHYFKLIAE